LKPQTEILWLDDALLVINKPAGLPTLPDGYNPDLPHVKSILEPSYGRLWIVHRLDKDTSGVLLLARSAQAHRHLNTQFEQRQVEKIYHALVVGVPEWVENTIDLPLRPNGDRKHRTVIDAQRGKPAVTRLRILERFECYALVEAIPETGRTHQIRAHLAAAGWPIACDLLYGKSDQPEMHTSRGEQCSPAEPPLLDRLGLHARCLEITHPVTGERMKFTAPYPQELEAALKRLRAE
jgi:tRNA pseudouridine32 synthase/23S rRNA pseudouridine746 synthase